jgi:hypothetical protein
MHPHAEQTGADEPYTQDTMKDQEKAYKKAKVIRKKLNFL